MSSDFAVVVKDLAKSYQQYAKPSDRLKQMIIGGRKQYFTEHHALKPISFNIDHGQVVGLVGQNGAGKSTLLQLICGTLRPTGGSVVVNGRIAALLELGSGFNPEFTGRENLFLNASILGLSEMETRERYEAIVEFSGVGAFIDQPVKTYSSGMLVRLAFAVATSVDPDILIIDEALSVGDGAFARKSFERIMELRSKGTTILFCSHSLYQIESLCDYAIWLDAGGIRESGDVQLVCHRYSLHLLKQSTAAADDDSKAPARGIPDSSDKVKLISSRLQRKVDDKWVASNHFETHDSLRLEVCFLNERRPFEQVAVAATFIDGNETILCSSSTHLRSIEPQQNGEGRFSVIFEVDSLPLLKGEYFISTYLLSKDGLLILDQKPWAHDFTVRQANNMQGVIDIGGEWRGEG